MKKRLKKYLIPHEENGYKPHMLRPKFVALVCLVMVVAESAFFVSSRYLAPRSKLFGIIVTNALVDEANQSRTSDGLPGLHENTLLDAAAQLKANDMAANSYFAHTSPTGLTPWYWFERVGYNFEYAGENLAVNFSDSQDVTNAWMNSPEHRANILDANYNDLGMATAQGTYEGHPATYVVELFGTEAPVQVAANGLIPGISAAQAATPPAPVKPKPVVKHPATSSIPIVVQSVATQTVSTTATQNTSTVAVGFISAENNPPIVKQLNAIQQAFSDPKTLANDFYLFLMVLFTIALGLNLFIKIRVQYPKLIFGGLLVIVVAGLAILFNQSSLIHAAIL